MGRRTVLSLGLAAFLAASARPDPAHAAESPVLDPERIICGDQFFPGGASFLCYFTAHAFYHEEWLPQVQGLLDGDPDAFDVITDSSTVLFADGTLATGLAELNETLPRAFGTAAFQIIDFDIDVQFKPISLTTVLAVGTVTFTFLDHEQGGITRTLDSVQMSIYRRNPSLARGWEHISEQFVYLTPLLGDVEPGEPICL